VVVSAEVAGRLLRFDPDEGDRLPAGALVGQIDTLSLALQRAELRALQRASGSRTSQAEAQIDVLRAQLATARDEHARIARLYEAEAATAQQLARSEGEVRVLEEQIRGARAQTTGAREEAGGAEARIARIDEQIARSRIMNPIAGTVLATYVEEGEFAQPGGPLYRIARLDTLTLRAYVSGGQLTRVVIGDEVRVQVDAGDGELRTVPGRVTWIASEAEFTPTPIQTREERTDLVYAVRIRVPNPDGAIKIGMPGEVFFGERSSP
jgi:HlyD family secretion protein